MYRVLAASTLGLLTAFAAHATSILTVPELTGDSDSVVTLGSAEPPSVEARPIGPVSAAGDDDQRRYEVGASLLAIGADAIPSAPAAVASVEKPAAGEALKLHDAPLPAVMRGGIVGDAFSAPPAPPAEPRQAEAAAEDDGAEPDEAETDEPQG